MCRVGRKWHYLILLSAMYKMLSIRLQRSLKNRYSCRAFNVVIWAVSGCPHLPAFPHGNGVTLEILWSLCIRAVLLIKTITVQLLLQFKSLHQTRNDLQEDPTTRGSQQLNSPSRTLAFTVVKATLKESTSRRRRRLYIDCV